MKQKKARIEKIQTRAWPWRYTCDCGEWQRFGDFSTCMRYATAHVYAWHRYEKSG